MTCWRPIADSENDVGVVTPHADICSAEKGGDCVLYAANRPISTVVIIDPTIGWRSRVCGVVARTWECLA
jgi:hypothetical protein